MRVHVLEGQDGETVFQGAMISSGKNLVNLLEILHRGIPSGEIGEKLAKPAENVSCPNV
jgi:hypothetical protein